MHPNNNDSGKSRGTVLPSESRSIQQALTPARSNRLLTSDSNQSSENEIDRIQARQLMGTVAGKGTEDASSTTAAIDMAQLSDELLAAISTSPNGSKSLCRSPRDRGMSDDSARNFGEVKQTPPLFMQPVIRKAVSTQRHNVLMVTDFTFPKFGGVETHGYQLGQCLMERGHRVTFLTN
jgi:hypothetical protein